MTFNALLNNRPHIQWQIHWTESLRGAVATSLCVNTYHDAYIMTILCDTLPRIYSIIKQCITINGTNGLPNIVNRLQVCVVPFMPNMHEVLGLILAPLKKEKRKNKK